MTVYYRREFPDTAHLLRNAASLVQFVDDGRASDFTGSQGDQRRDELNGPVRFTATGRHVVKPDTALLTLVDSTSAVMLLSRYAVLLCY